MATLDTQAKEFVQETLKINGLIAAEQLSAIAAKLLGEQGEVLNFSDDKKKKLNELLKELNEELTAAREDHEAREEEAEGYKVLIKPFVNVFSYISENTHEKHAKDLAMEAAKLFLKEGSVQLIKTALTAETLAKVKDLAISGQSKINSATRNIKHKH